MCVCGGGVLGRRTDLKFGLGGGNIWIEGWSQMDVVNFPTLFKIAIDTSSRVDISVAFRYV